MELSGFRNSIVHDNINEYPRNRDYDDFMMDDLNQSRRASMMERSRTTIERDFAQSQSDAKNALSAQISTVAAPEKCKCFYSTKLVLKIFISVLVFTNLLTAAVVGGGVHLYYDKHAHTPQCRTDVEETQHLYGDNPAYGRSQVYAENPPYGPQYRRPINQGPRYRKQKISVNPTYTKQQVAENPNYKTYRILLRPPTASNDTTGGPGNDAGETLENNAKTIVARSQIAGNDTPVTIDSREIAASRVLERFQQAANVREPKKLLPRDHLGHNSTSTSSSPSTSTTSSVAAALIAKQSTPL